MYISIIINNGTFLRIAVFPGDGIGIEVIDACLTVLKQLEREIDRLNETKSPKGGTTSQARV